MQLPPYGVPHHYSNNDPFAPTTGYLQQPVVSKQHTLMQPQAFGQPGAYDPRHDPLHQDSLLARQADVEPMRISRNRELFSTPQGQPPQSFPSFPPPRTYNQQQPFSEAPVAPRYMARQVGTESNVFHPPNFTAYAPGIALFTEQDCNLSTLWCRDDFLSDPSMNESDVPTISGVAFRSPGASIVLPYPTPHETPDATDMGTLESWAESQHGLVENRVDQHESKSKRRLEEDAKAQDEDNSKTKNTTSRSQNRTEEAHSMKNEYGMYFNSFEEASSRVQGLNWPPRLDETLPAGSAARRAIVKELLAAMNVTSDVKDKKGSVFKKRWGQAQGPDSPTSSGEEGDQNDENPPHPATRVNGFFKQQWMERKCWELLVRALSLIRVTDARR
jgi:hypothetical protein